MKNFIYDCLGFFLIHVPFLVLFGVAGFIVSLPGMTYAIVPPIPAPEDDFEELYTYKRDSVDSRFPDAQDIAQKVEKQLELEAKIEIPPPLTHLNHDEVRKILITGRLQDLSKEDRNAYLHWQINQHDGTIDNNQQVGWSIVGVTFLLYLTLFGLCPKSETMKIAPPNENWNFSHKVPQITNPTKDEQYERWHQELQEFIDSIGAKS